MERQLPTDVSFNGDSYPFLLRVTVTSSSRVDRRICRTALALTGTGLGLVKIF